MYTHPFARIEQAINVEECAALTAAELDVGKSQGNYSGLLCFTLSCYLRQFATLQERGLIFIRSDQKGPARVGGQRGAVLRERGPSSRAAG